jgi:hypothetical protein
MADAPTPLIILSILLFALGILAIWAGILWLFARADRPYLEAKRVEQLFGNDSGDAEGRGA